MTVWVLECGCYSDRGIAAVYATLEAGIADNPIPANGRLSEKHAPGWQLHSEGTWLNGLDWDDHKTLTQFEVAP